MFMRGEKTLHSYKIYRAGLYVYSYELLQTCGICYCIVCIGALEKCTYSVCMVQFNCFHCF